METVKVAQRSGRFLLSKCAAVAVALSVSTSVGAASGKLFTMGTAGVTGVYYAVGGALCRMLGTELRQQGNRCVVENTGGSVFNMNALKAGEVDVAIVQSDVVYHAYTGQHQFSRVAPYDNIRGIFALYPEVFTLVANKGSPMTQFTDFQQRRFNVGAVGSGQRIAIDRVLAQLNTDESFFSQVTELRADDQGRALCEQKIDGFLHVVGQPSATIQDPTTSCGAQLLPLTGAIADGLIQQYPYYRKAVIPADTYPNNPYDIETIGVLANVVTTADADYQLVYALTQNMYENFDDFRRLHPAFSGLHREDLVRAMDVVPLHPAAADFYRSKGLIPE